MAARKRSGPGALIAILLLVLTTYISVRFINDYHPNNNMPSYPYVPAPTWCQPPTHCTVYGPPSPIPSGYVPPVTPLTG